MSENTTRIRWSDPSFRAADITSLARTPRILREIVADRPSEWLDSRHGSDCLSPREVLGHFVVNETDNWMPRIHLILEAGESQPFTPFDPFSGNKMSYEKSVEDLLNKFTKLRKANLEELNQLGITTTDLTKTGLHPKFGRVTLDQQLSTWVAHDLYHLGQIFKSFAAPLKPAIGPWQEFLNLPHFN